MHTDSLLISLRVFFPPFLSYFGRQPQVSRQYLPFTRCLDQISITCVMYFGDIL